VSDAKVASTGAFYPRLPNQPNQKSLHACRILNCDTTLRYAKVEETFVTAMGVSRTLGVAGWQNVGTLSLR